MAYYPYGYIYIAKISPNVNYKYTEIRLPLYFNESSNKSRLFFRT